MRQPVTYPLDQSPTRSCEPGLANKRIGGSQGLGQCWFSGLLTPHINSPRHAQNQTLLSNVDRLIEKACAAVMTAGL